jgi:hypothetical protein
MKKCSKCEMEKPFEAYSPDKTGRDGFRARCKACCVQDVMDRRAKNPEKYRLRQKKWRESNAEHLKASKAKYNAETGYEKARYQKDKRSAKDRTAKWRQENRALIAMREAERRAAIKLQTPVWADEAETLAIYQDCAERRKAGEDVQVDHIVPLNSDRVSGLHWSGNLRIIPASKNSSKRNFFWPDMFEVESHV